MTSGAPTTILRRGNDLPDQDGEADTADRGPRRPISVNSVAVHVAAELLIVHLCSSSVNAGGQGSANRTLALCHFGWKIWIAAGCDAAARTAKKSRSNSATNNEVRAPDTVGIRAMR